MADRTPNGTAVDERAKQIRARRIQHDVHAMQVTIEKLEIDVLEAEQNIERTHESIAAMRDRIEEKKAELRQFGDPEVST